jgi:hypothetical protein
LTRPAPAAHHRGDDAFTSRLEARLQIVSRLSCQRAMLLIPRTFQRAVDEFFGRRGVRVHSTQGKYPGETFPSSIVEKPA